MEIFGLTAEKLSLIIATLNGIAAAVIAFLKAYENLAAKITLRIEKDSADGHWSNKEKEDLAVKIYVEDVYPKLPPQLKLLSRLIGGKKQVRKLVKKLCAKAHALKKNEQPKVPYRVQ